MPLDYLPQIHSNLFLSTDDSLHNETQLYSVEQGELQPISSPFMVPGIYRKIDMGTTAKPVPRVNSSNVFITESEPHGRIVSINDFHKLYACKNKHINEVNNNGKPPKVFLINNEVKQQNELESSEKVTKTENHLPKQWDVLTKLAYNILKLSNQNHCVVINRGRNEIVRTENTTNQKTIYRFVENEELGVKPPDSIEDKCNEISSMETSQPKYKKLGRPRKRLPNSENTNLEKNSVTKTKLPKISHILGSNKTSTSNIENTVQLTSTENISRYGRVIKTKNKTTLNAQQTGSTTQINSSEHIRELISNLKDKDYICNSKLIPNENKNSEKSKIEIESQPVPIATSSPTKRYVPPESICPTCKKIFLGRRLKRHFVVHPDHMKTETTTLPTPINVNNSNVGEDMSIFRFLVSKLQKSNLNEDQRADLFLHELNDLVEQLQSRSSRLIRNTSGLHLVTARTARILAIPEGQYTLDIAAIEAPPEPEPTCLMNFDVNVLPVPLNNTRSLDYTAISLDDNLTDEAAQKLNLSAGGKLLPPSEESLLRAVDDLVPSAAGMNKLVVTTNHLHPPVGVNNNSSVSSARLVPHYDHASDNAVEATTIKENSNVRQAPPILDLAVDFFQFNTK